MGHSKWTQEFARRLNFRIGIDGPIDVTLNRDDLIALVGQIVTEAQEEALNVPKSKNRDKEDFIEIPKRSLHEIHELLDEARRPKVHFTSDILAMASEAQDEMRKRISYVLEILRVNAE